MKNLLLSPFSILLLVSCSSLDLNPIQVERCITNESHSMICKDPRIGKDAYRVAPIPANYICTNPDDYESLKGELIDLKVKLKQALVDLDSCKR